MSLAKASVWTAASTLVKIGVGLLVVKLLAVSFGPSGVGQAGNFRQLVTVLGVLAGAGIFNGVTKFVAQHHDDPMQLRKVVGTSSAMVLGFSTLLAIVFLLAAAPISQGLFGHTEYQGLVRLVALVQMGIAWANLLLALMKGFRDAAGNALSLIAGSIIGVVAYYACYRFGGYQGALLGLALVPALIVIPAAVMLTRRGTIPWGYLKPQWDTWLAGQLGKFTLMALITSVTLPVAYVMMRNLMAAHYSWDEVGIWQGVSSISDAYLQFITASFSVYLLPTLSRLTGKIGDHPRNSSLAEICFTGRRGGELYRVVVARFRYLAALFREVCRHARPVCVATGGRCAESRRLRIWLSGDCQSIAAPVYPCRNQPVHVTYGIFTLADPGTWRAGRGTSLYGNLHCLFRPLLRRVFNLA
jgi:Membrane protein involved in the export of O-antigen and teichoic acid